MAVFLLLLIVQAIPISATYVFTGDAPADFMGAGILIFPDPGAIDVGLPLVAPLGTISGNDMEGVYLVYS